jgi:hypothetical protein
LIIVELDVILLVVMADKSAPHIPSRTELFLVIDNQLKYAYLTSPVLFMDNGKIIKDLAPKIAPKTSMTAELKKKVILHNLKGALIYELPNESKECRFYIFVAWKANSCRATNIYTRLLVDQPDATVDVHRLEDIYQNLSHHLEKPRNGALTQSYIFENKTGISLTSCCTGRVRGRVLHITITDTVNEVYAIRPLWIGSNVEAQDIEKVATMKTEEKTSEVVEHIENTQQMNESGREKQAI